ncbi:MAG: type II toxin-antitoxin system VapC family toxin [Solirubrobacteraceae bacterium]
MTLLYADASAIVKRIREEPESAALLAYVSGADLISCDLVLAEVPRAILRAISSNPALDPDGLGRRVTDVLNEIDLLPVEAALLEAAGRFAEPSLRTLDAIHVAAALVVAPDAFVTYDIRQAAAARLAGLRTVAPGDQL